MTPASPPPIGLRLIDRLQGFLDRLRDAGLSVGSGAGVDLGSAITVITPLDRGYFLDACRTTLAKSPEDLAILDRIFPEFWSTRGPPPVPPASEEGKVPTARRERRTSRPPRGRPASPREERETQRVEGRYSPRAPSIGQRIEPVPPAELRRYRRAARRFRRDVAALPGRAWHRTPTGPIDLRRTAGRVARTAGEWIELRRHDRAVRRSELVILWDVSGSMREHTRSLFALLHVLHRTIHRTRVFAFGHRLEEVTPELRGEPYERSAERVPDHLAATGGGTQIARCLAEFRGRYGAELRPSTTVLIVSDGWDLGDAARLRVELEAIARSSARIVWMNPYAAEKGFRPATGALETALPFIDRMTSPADFPRAHGPRRTARRGPPLLGVATGPA